MVKKLRQVIQNNPTVDYVKPGKEKEFAGLHKVQKTDDANGNDDEVFKASKVKVAPYKGRSDSPKDSYGPGHDWTNVKEDTINELSGQTLGRYIDRAAISTNAMSYLAGREGKISGVSGAFQGYGKSAKALERKAGQRVEGIQRAARKLTKEQMISEISRKTLASYMGKAQDKLFYGRGKLNNKKEANLRKGIHTASLKNIPWDDRWGRIKVKATKE